MRGRRLGTPPRGKVRHDATRLTAPFLPLQSRIDPAAVAQVWQANQLVLGSPEKSSVAFPKPNDASSCAAKKGLSGTMSYFAGGGIVFTVGGRTHAAA